MPEAPPAPAAPSAPAVAPTPAPSTVTAGAPSNPIEPLPVPSTPPKRGSARERMRNETATKWEGAPEPAKPGEPAKAGEPAKPAEAGKPNEAGKPAEAPKPGDEPDAENHPPTDLTPEQKKQNPWKLYRQTKDRVQQLEKQLAEAKTASLGEQEKTEYQTRIEKAEKRLKEQEDELRFKSYEKSEEYQTKYEQPYKDAWFKHMADLNGVTVTEDGVARPMRQEDILDLVNLSLPDARRLAKEKFGDFADDAMLARKDIRNLFEAKSKALEDARKTGADREKQFQENTAKWRADTQKRIKDTWETANREAQGDPVNGEFFRPVDGDDARNELLTKGYSLVDEAFAKDPMDPKLSPEERDRVVRMHNAIRNRAAAFGPLKHALMKLRMEIEALKKANAEFKGSQPPTAGGTAPTPGGAPGGGSARERMHAAGDRLAK